MARYLLKASDEEFDAWRAAAGGALAPWIRGRLNAAANEDGLVPSAATRAVSEAMGRAKAPIREMLGEPSLPSLRREFRPDFKGGER